MAFKVGDRVVRIGTPGIVPVGKKGVVLSAVDGEVEVRWEGDKPPVKHKYNDEGKGDGHGISDFIALEAVESTMTLSAACEAYTAACAHFENAQETLERAKAAVADARILVERALEQEPAP